MADRVLRGNETVLFIPAYVDATGTAYALYKGGMVDIDNMSVAAFNAWVPVNSAGHADAHGGGNVSCAIKDDMTLGKTDSDTDSDRTICDVGQVENPTTEAYEGSATGYRDADPAANGAFNLFRKITFGPDAPYIVAHRIGRKQTELSVANDEVDLYLFDTDVQVPNFSDKANVTDTARLIPKSEVRFAQKLKA